MKQVSFIILAFLLEKSVSHGLIGLDSVKAGRVSSTGVEVSYVFHFPFTWEKLNWLPILYYSPYLSLQNLDPYQGLVIIHI